MLKYQCDRCPNTGEYGPNHPCPEGWGYISGKDYCPNCYASFKEIRDRLDADHKRLLDLWFKEIK